MVCTLTHTHSQGLNCISSAGRLLSEEGSLDLMPCLALLTAPHISREGIEPWRGRVCVCARCDWLDWLQLVTHTKLVCIEKKGGDKAAPAPPNLLSPPALL